MLDWKTEDTLLQWPSLTCRLCSGRACPGWANQPPATMLLRIHQVREGKPQWSRAGTTSCNQYTTVNMITLAHWLDIHNINTNSPGRMDRTGSNVQVCYTEGHIGYYRLQCDCRNVSLWQKQFLGRGMLNWIYCKVNKTPWPIFKFKLSI